jgi:hypothetical protein
LHFVLKLGTLPTPKHQKLETLLALGFTKEFAPETLYDAEQIIVLPYEQGR